MRSKERAAEGHARRRPMACQTWLWEMQQDRWTGTVDDILDTARRAGLDGVELTTAVLTRWRGGADDLHAAVTARGLSVACLRYSMPTGFTRPSDEESEWSGLERAARVALTLGTRQLGLKGASDPYPHVDRHAKAAHAYRMYTEIARRVAELGLSVNVHLHSHSDAIISTADEWDMFMDATDPGVRVCADTGHLLRSGYDPVAMINRHRRRINHVHLKDATPDGEFPPLGQGPLDLTGVLTALKSGAYAGWVVLEEEHESQTADPVSALRAAAALVRGAGW